MRTAVVFQCHFIDRFYQLFSYIKISDQSLLLEEYSKRFTINDQNDRYYLLYLDMWYSCQFLVSIDSKLV